MGNKITGILVDMKGKQLPTFSALPRVMGMTGGVKADGFIGSATFNKSVLVYGHDDETIEKHLTKAFAEWYVKYPKFSLEVLESSFILYRNCTLMSVEQIKEGGAAAVELADILSVADPA